MSLATAGRARRRGGAIVARAVAAYLQRVAGTSVVVNLAPAASWRLQATIAEASRNVMVVYFMRDVLPLAMMSDVLSRAGGNRGFGAVNFLCDDSFGGHVSAWLLAHMGLRSQMLRRSTMLGRVKDIQQIIRSRKSIGMAIDGHGPYGDVGPSIVRLAERLDALLIPVAAQVIPGVTVRLRAPLRLPLPGARLSVAVGEPVPVDSCDEARLKLAAELQRVSQLCDSWHLTA